MFLTAVCVIVIVFIFQPVLILACDGRPAFWVYFLLMYVSMEITTALWGGRLQALEPEAK
jgi:hypothetical protein